MPFKQMENIATFLAALSKLPTFRSFDLFSTVDLYEGKNMAQVTRCILACKRFAEKEALSKGIEKLNISGNEIEQPVKINKTEAEMDPIVEEVGDKEMQTDEIEELDEESNLNSESSENQDQHDEVLQDNISELNYSIDPEIVLIESPVFADDESDPIIVEKREDFQEEYETFTPDNPGTFEIQVSN